MCQESLIHYLDTTLNPSAAQPVLPPKPQQGSSSREPFCDRRTGAVGLDAEVATVAVGREDLETFIRRGELSLEHDATTAAKPHETETYTFELPAAIREHAAALDAALAEDQDLRPAIGSGAFPVGMMHEIVKARTVLTPHLSLPPHGTPRAIEGGNRGGATTPPTGEDRGGAHHLPPTGEDRSHHLSGGIENRSPYALKRHAIQASIYGVDIDPGAVDIAKLRLWLSLVVDEERYDQIQPLPNLDYKIVCGNALLGYPETWHSPASERLER